MKTSDQIHAAKLMLRQAVNERWLCLFRTGNTNVKQESKIKIGFVNCFANRLHSVTRDRAGIIINMDPNVFDKHLIYLQEDTQQFPLVNQLMEAIPASNHHKIRGEQFLFQPESILKNLGDCQFDIIVFCGNILAAEGG